MSLLEAEGVHVGLPGARRRGGPDILSGVSLSLAPAEALGLVGESGSGKTTLARALLGLVPAQGRVAFEGRAGAGATAALRRRAAILFQDPVASLSPRLSVGRAVTEPFVIHGLSVDRPAKAAELLDRVGLPAALAARYPHELSGGQARRVCVARALALSPALLVADEPTAGLDVSVQGEVLNLLATLREEAGLALLVISHNLAVVRHLADRVAVLYLGRLVEEGPAEAVFADPLHPYTRGLLASEPSPDPRRRRTQAPVTGEIPSLLSRPSGCPFHPRCPRAVARCRAEAPALRPLAPGRRAACHLA